MTADRLRRRIRFWLILFIVGLVVSGVTAFPLVWEVHLLDRFVGRGTIVESRWPALAQWISTVTAGLDEADRHAPFLFYGTDWLAFAHLVIAIAFWGPLRDPVKNIWVVEFGLIACVLVLPLALICGPLRGIPFFWRVLDCSFGVFGFLPLWLVRSDILRLSRPNSSDG